MKTATKPARTLVVCWCNYKAPRQTSRNSISSIWTIASQQVGSWMPEGEGMVVFLGSSEASSWGKGPEGGRSRGERHSTPQEGSSMRLLKQGPLSWSSCPTSRQTLDHQTQGDATPLHGAETPLKTAIPHPLSRTHCSVIKNRGDEYI